MSLKHMVAGVLSLGVVVLGAGVALQAAEDVDAGLKERLAKAEAGPATIDVSAYPAALQQTYDVFVKKCSQCHRISRAINSDYALPDEWERYIKRMMHKPGSGIDKSEGKQIYEFLVYDSNVRKKDALQKKLGELPEADRATNEAKLKEVTDTYK